MSFTSVLDDKLWALILQERLVKGFNLVHETYGAYKTIDELWDGEL